MNSCLYTGWVNHRRLRPRQHTFRYRLFMVYLDLAELGRVFQGRWLWSTRRFALARFRREDHFGDPNLPLDTCVRDRVEQETGRRPRGPIRLLTNLRYFGYCFNPISIYYCFNPEGDQVENLAVEVTNTPWGERHCYVLDCTGQSQKHYFRFAKAMHVSPFMPINLVYDWHSQQPGEQLGVHMNVLEGEEKLFDATLSLRRQSINGAHLAAVLIRFPAITVKVIAAIYWQALRLWLKQIPLFDHPVQHDNGSVGNTNRTAEG